MRYNPIMTGVKIKIPMARLAGFCQRWNISEFAVFGSVLRADFGPDSDVDALVSFAPQARESLFDMVRMQEELNIIFGRQVDLVTRRALEQSRNSLLRSEILGTARLVYSDRERAHVQAP